MGGRRVHPLPPQTRLFFLSYSLLLPFFNPFLSFASVFPNLRFASHYHFHVRRRGNLHIHTNAWTNACTHTARILHLCRKQTHGSTSKASDTKRKKKRRGVQQEENLLLKKKRQSKQKPITIVCPRDFLKMLLGSQAVHYSTSTEGRARSSLIHRSTLIRTLTQGARRTK